MATRSRYVIVGAGIHGLSTAWHLARELRSRGLGSGEDILVLDKTSVGAGASGIACGVIRNNYFQPAMRELMAHSVAIWESDPEAFAYHAVDSPWMPAPTITYLLRSGIIRVPPSPRPCGGIIAVKAIVFPFL